MRCELDLDGPEDRVCLTRLNRDGTCPNDANHAPHHRAPVATDPTDRGAIADVILSMPELDTEWETVAGRYVLCDQETALPVPDVCPSGMRYSVYRGRHSHYTPYETPHRRLVVRLPAEPGEAR